MALKFSSSKEIKNITLNSKTPPFGEGRNKTVTRTIRKEYRNEDMRTGCVNS